MKTRHRRVEATESAGGAITLSAERFVGGDRRILTLNNRAEAHILIRKLTALVAKKD